MGVVIDFLRLIGMVNAAVWFGSGIFFMAVVAPAIFSPEMLGLIPRPYAGAAAQVVIQRYFILHYWCGAVALVHLLAEWLYTGKPIQRVTLWLLAVIIGLSLIGGFWLQPRLKQLHLAKYGTQSTPPQREQAGRAFDSWHHVSVGAHLVMTAGLLVYFWQLTGLGGLPRFLGGNKFRG